MSVFGCICVGIEASDYFVLLASENIRHDSYAWHELSLARAARKTVFVLGVESGVKKYLASPDASHRQFSPKQLPQTNRYDFNCLRRVLIEGQAKPTTVVLSSWSDFGQNRSIGFCRSGEGFSDLALVPGMATRNLVGLP